MRNVIISRKGFDSVYGGISSVIFEGKLISIPIPEVETGIRYDELRFTPNDSFLKLLTDLNCTKYTECHLDPDLNQNLLDRIEWKPMFGQNGQPANLLMKAKIAIDDIILFYGWFREIEQIKGKYQYIKNAKDLHCIYGYMIIDKIYNQNDIINNISYFGDHPHSKKSTYHKLDYLNDKSNMIFESKKNRCGYFYFNENLILTSPSSQTRSVWTLPLFFENEKFNGKYKFVEKTNTSFSLQWVGMNNQELLISNSSQIQSWAADIISCKTYC